MKFRQLLADECRAWGPEYVGRYLPAPNVPVVLAEGPHAWFGAQVPLDASHITRRLCQTFEGPLEMAPPLYEHFWVEGMVVDTDHGPVRLGTMVHAFRDDDGGWRCDSWGWRCGPSGIPIPPPIGCTWTVEPSGRTLISQREADGARWGMLAAPWTPQRHRRGGQSVDNDSDLATRMEVVEAIYQAGLAIVVCAFAACRNVRLADATAPPKVAAKRARSLRLDEPMHKVSRIMLPSSTGRATGQRLGAIVGAQELPEHLVRAHPKTFTADAPLFGRHVGRYLWGPQVRGNPERGSRTPQVVVDVPKDEVATDLDDR